jgi:hypothetical protein
MATDNRRSYGLGDSTPYIQGIPHVVGEASGLPPCPHCGCNTLYVIEVDVRNPMLRTGVGVGRYIGCPACPFASPLLMTAVDN